MTAQMTKEVEELVTVMAQQSEEKDSGQTVTVELDEHGYIDVQL